MGCPCQKDLRSVTEVPGLTGLEVENMWMSASGVWMVVRLYTLPVESCFHSVMAVGLSTLWMQIDVMIYASRWSSWWIVNIMDVDRCIRSRVVVLFSLYII